MKTINGKLIASELNNNLKSKISYLKKKYKFQPKLVVILVGKNPASEVYVRNKSIKAAEVGIKSVVKRLDAKTTEEEILKLISIYNQDNKIDGILVQLPIPMHIKSENVIDSISFEKDVDGFNSKNIGLLALGRPHVIPCTPLGCLKLLQGELDLSGKDVIIIGRSNIVGKPLSLLLTSENATVTLAHSKTKNLKSLCRNKDVIIAATGIPNMVKKDWVNNKSIIIDVGINQILDNNKNKILVGDVDFAEVFSKVKAITPVPGGVGPMTIHCLLQNTLDLALKRRNIKEV